MKKRRKPEPQKFKLTPLQKKVLYTLRMRGLFVSAMTLEASWQAGVPGRIHERAIAGCPEVALDFETANQEVDNGKVQETDDSPAGLRRLRELHDR